jgi:hypothetical protein
MSRVNKLRNILSSLDGKVNNNSRTARKQSLLEMIKTAESSMLQDGAGHVLTYETQPHKTVERGGKPSTQELYGVGLPDHKNVDLSTKVYSRSLSTRYSPDRVGVQARRVSDGVYQDPITNKKYDWNEGFTSDDGSKFFGGSVDLQTDILYRE